MPSWKKVIISGSAAALSSLNVTGGITGSSVLISGSTGTLFSSNVDTLVLTGSLLVTGSTVLSGSLNVSQGVTGSLFGTASWAVSASWAPVATTAATASFVTASNVYGPFGSNSILSSSFASTASFITGSTNAFIQNGNSFGTTALLGTNDNQSLALETSGSTRMFISSSGLVGIGTTSPTVALQVGDTTSGTGNYIKVLGNNSDSTYDVFVGARRYPRFTLEDTTVGGSAFQMWSLGNTMRFGTNTGTVETSAWYTKAGNAADVIFNGKVGIGTTSPNAKLDISGSLNISGSGVQVPLQVYSGSTPLLFVSQSGKVGIGTSTFVGSIKLAVNGQIGGPTYSSTYLDVTGDAAQLRGNSGIGFYAASSDHIFYGASNAERVRITNAGNVGIGTTAPNYKLHVTGSGTSGSFNADGILIVSGSNVGIGTATPYSRFTTLGALSTSTSQMSIVNSEGGHTILRTGISGLTNSGFSLISADVAGTNQNTRLVVSSTGNVGIGTTSPNAKLDVSGSAIISGSFTVTPGTVREFQVRTTGVDIGNVITDTHTVTGSLNVSGSITGSLFGTSSWAVSASWTPTPALATTASYALTSSNVQGGTANYIPLWNTATSLSSSAIYQSAGNVGIGTTSPTKRLQLNISASDDGFLIAKSGSANNIFRVTMDGTNDRGEMFLNNGGTIVFAVRQASNPSYINTGNNFGIGTTTPNAKLDVNGNAIVTGSLNVTAGITGSLFGTASWAVSASWAPATTTAATASFVTASNVFGPFGSNSILSSSFAQTASFAPLYLPLTGGTITGNVTVNGTASIAFLNVQYESASVIYSSGSNVFGDATNDTQTLNGTVLVSGSQQITGSLNVSGGITGSLFGTSSWASNAVTASNITPAITNSSDNYILTDNGDGTINGEGNLTFDGSLLTINGQLAQGDGSAQAIGTAAHAEGNTTIAQGDYSHAEGFYAIASGLGSHGEGNTTVAYGDYSHAEGRETIALGRSSHAEGYYTTASGDYSHAEGFGTTANGTYSHAEGSQTIALGEYSHAEGYYTTASGDYSHAEGFDTTAFGTYSHAEGESTQAVGQYSHAEGRSTVASGSHSHAEGDKTVASGSYSHAEGNSTIASGSYSHAEGRSTVSTGNWSHAEGYLTRAQGDYSHAEGFSTIAQGSSQHVQGQYNISSSAQSAFIIGNGTADNARSNLIFASGSQVQVTGSVIATQGFSGSLFGTASYALTAVTFPYSGSAQITGSLGITGSLSQGSGSIATGLFSHAQGDNTLASGRYSHTEGLYTTASGTGSHAEGNLTIASGSYSHAEGKGSIAYGESSHAEGNSTQASGAFSHAEGLGTITNASYQHAQGQFNISSSVQSAFIVGNGTSTSARSNLIFAAGSEVQITGSVIATQGITGSLFGTSSWATNVLTATNANSASVTDTTTGTGPYYLTFVDGTSGNRVVRVDSSTLQFNATTNTLTVTNLAGTASLATTAATASFITGSTNAFIQGGNIGFGTTARLGTIDNQSLAFNTNNTTRMFISTSGNVGIGTTGPNAKLDVNGNAIITGSLTVTTGSGIEFQVTNTGVKIGNIITDVHTVTGSLNVSGSITGSLFGTASWATNASKVTVSTNSEPVAFKVPFAGTAVSTTGNYELLQDSETTFTYNPSTNTLTVPNLTGTASLATTATTASFVTASNVFGPFGSNSILSSSFAISSSRAVSSSFAISSSNATTASFVTTAQTASYVLQAVSSSFATTAATASYVLNAVSASFASTASFVNTLNQSVIITGSAAIGTSSLGPSENSLTLGARDGASEGGQIGFNAPGGTYTSASFIDNWQNNIRILRGNNTTSDATVATWNLHTRQMQLPAYTSTSAFPGTATANLAVDSGGNVITVSTSGGSVFPYTGNAVITGSLTTTQAIYSQVNGGMYFQGGDDAALYDINISNHMGIYGVQDSTVGTIKLGSGGGTVSGQGGNIGINTTNPTSASLTVNGNVWATSFTGSLFGTASQAISASWAPTPTTAATASFVTASNVFGPFGSNSILSASFAVSSSRAVTSSFALTSSYAINQTISGSINNVDYIDFNTGSATPAWKSGRVFWDNTDGCLAVYNAEADITLQVGQENWTRVFNDTGVTIANGAPVRIVGTHGDYPEVVLAASIQVSGSSNLVNQILGVATHAIETGTYGFITTQGLVRGLNTNAFNDGDTLYLSSSAGQLTNTIPQAPYEIVPVAQVVKASPGASGILYVAVQQPIDFTDLSSVYLGGGTYTDGDLWTYNGPTKTWRHTNQLSGSYGITGSLGQGVAVAATGIGSHAQGNQTLASGIYSHAEGRLTTSSGQYSHAEGYYAIADGNYSHAEGSSTTATGISSHAEGYNTTATGNYSHAEGEGGNAIGNYSHIEGLATLTLADYSHAAGNNTVASGQYQSVIGQYNISSSAPSAFIVGNGTGTGASRSNLIFASGSQVQITGSVIATQGFTGSLFGTASNALSSSNFVVTNTLALDATLIDYAFVNPTVSGLNTIYTQATGSFTSAFMKYTVSSGSNTRAGEFMTAWNGTNIVYTDTSTTDIGNTSGISFLSAIVSSQLRVSASCTTAGWNVKTLSTFM